jgi:hypothetical protein
MRRVFIGDVCHREVDLKNTKLIFKKVIAVIKAMTNFQALDSRIFTPIIQQIFGL